MSARLDSVCKYICERSGWRVSNLQLQKLLYLAQMIHMGRHGGVRLADAQFEAWDYGPVGPRLYQKAKVFGSDNIQDVFYDARTFRAGDPRCNVMNDVCDRFANMSAGDLVEITHWDKGAWAKNYVPKARNIIIPDSDIIREYRARCFEM